MESFAGSMRDAGFEAEGISMGRISNSTVIGNSVSEKTLYEAAVSLVRGLAGISG